MCYHFIYIIPTGLGNNPWKDILLISLFRAKLRLKSKLIDLRSLSCHMENRTQIQVCLLLKPIHSLPEVALLTHHLSGANTGGTSCGGTGLTDDLEAVYTEMVFTTTEWTRQPRKGEGSIRAQERRITRKKDEERGVEKVRRIRRRKALV